MSTSMSPGSFSPDPYADEDLPPEDPRFRVMRRLVNLLLIVLIVGVMAIVLGLLWKLKQTTPATVTGVAASEDLIGAQALPDRITLVLRDRETGVERVVELDGATFLPRGEAEPRSD